MTLGGVSAPQLRRCRPGPVRHRQCQDGHVDVDVDGIGAFGSNAFRSSSSVLALSRWRSL